MFNQFFLNKKLPKEFRKIICLIIGNIYQILFKKKKKLFYQILNLVY